MSSKSILFLLKIHLGDLGKTVISFISLTLSLTLSIPIVHLHSSHLNSFQIAKSFPKLTSAIQTTF